MNLCTNLDADPTSHHARGLIPYISAEHHEQQKELDIGQDTASMLEVAVGDHLLLPSGSRTILCKVRSVESAYVNVQYYKQHPDAAKGKGKANQMSDLELVWWRQNPNKTEEDIERIVAPFLTKAQVKRGFTEPSQSAIVMKQNSERSKSSPGAQSAKPLGRSQPACTPGRCESVASRG